MKKHLLTLIVLVAGLTVTKAQQATTSFDVNGIKVIFKPTQKNVINVRIYFRGGVTNYPASQAGIEDMALYGAAQCGTQKYTASAFKDTCDKYGLLIFGRSSYDYGYIQVNCISQYIDKGWDLFTEAVMHPAYNPADFSLFKNRVLSDIRSYTADPDNKLKALEMKNAFATTPYRTDPVGTEETVAAFTPDDIAKYYQTLLNKNKMFIVVVGNITKEDVYQKIITSFDKIASQPYTTPELTPPMLNDNKLMTEQRDLKLNYVGAIMNAPEFTSDDYVPYRLAVAGLGGNLYAYLRSSHSLSYDPNASTYTYRMPYTIMSASSNSPQLIMQGMMNVLKYVQRQGYNDEWLQHIKNGYITNNYINDQSASQITNNLGLAEVLGNWHYADDFPQLVNMVTVGQVNEVINRYIIGLRWSYLGDRAAIEGFKVPQF